MRKISGNVYLWVALMLPASSFAAEPIVLYELNEGQGETVIDSAANGSPLHLDIADTNAVSWFGGGLRVHAPTVIQSATSATKVSNAIKTSNEITIEAWVSVDNDSQTGPARIVSLSNTPAYRNFTLGQFASQYDIRLRTDDATISNNGIPSTRSELLTVTPLEKQHVVYTLNTAGLATIYINGVVKTTSTIPGTLSNWNDTYSLMLVNESDSTRPWLGSLYRIAIFDQALSAAEIAARFDVGSESVVSPVVLYEINEGQGTILADTAANGTPLDLSIADTTSTSWLSGGISIHAPTVIQSATSAAKVSNAVKASNEITIEAWVSADNDSQTGPARIVSLSGSPSYRNFTLGQFASQYDIRLRSDDSSISNNGIPSTRSDLVSVTPSLKQHIVYTRNAIGLATIYINGTARATKIIPGSTSNWNATYPLMLANEISGDRPWLGDIYKVAIFDRALAPTVVASRFEGGSENVTSSIPTSYSINYIIPSETAANSYLPAAINNAAKVVGSAKLFSSYYSKAFEWDQENGLFVYPNYYGFLTSVSNNGDSGGVISNSTMWTWPTVVKASGEMLGYSYQGRTVDINDHGYAAVRTEYKGTELWNYITNEAFPLPFAPNSEIRINNNNLTVGHPPGETTAHLYDAAILEAGGAPELVDIGHLGIGNSGASDINDSGIVVGSSSSTMGDCATGCGYLYSTSTGIHALAKLSSQSASAVSVNEAGLIVGHARTESKENRAVIWGENVIVDLNTLIPSIPGLTLTNAVDINDSAQITGYGVLNGESIFFILTPSYTQ